MPYWSGATYRGILRSVLTGRVVTGPDLNQIQSLVIETLGVEEAVLCGSGSLALEIALRACGVGQGDEVVIPTFCCTAVVPPVLAVGAVPVFADVGAELNITVETVDAALTKKTKAVIVPHLFGNPADIGAIIDLARGKNIRVIDDAAQALGATIDGQPVGSFGDAGILSFGSEKVCAGLGGGVVVFRDKEILKRGVNIERPRALLFSMLWRRWTLPLLSRLNAAGPGEPPAPYRKETMANLNAAVALSLMQTLRKNVAVRRERVAAYRELLRTEERLTLMPHQRGSACLTQVVRVLPKRRGEDSASEIIEVLGNARYEIQGSYVPIHLIPPHQKWVRDTLSQAESVWEDLIELPCEPDVSFDHVERIASIVKRVVNS
ncbi:MAG: aminotransferase class V-fold PLP-dependent enzyme [Deltaproteobacteria bacterium]|nr:aminotransferase class V-fold PLP-dependent enzyme [Deltaproteobacteria bacterium]